MSKSDRYSLQKERPVTTEREAWNDIEGEIMGGLHKRMKFPFQNYQNHVLPYRKLVTIYTELQGIHSKFG